MTSKRKQVSKKIGRTKTNSFGSSGRRSHDSSEFYRRKLYTDEKPGKSSPYLESPIPPTVLDKIFGKSSENMADVPDSSIHLIVTSPPYNSGKDYDEDLGLSQYREFLKRVMSEGKNCLRLCYGYNNPDEIRDGIALLSDVFSRGKAF